MSMLYALRSTLANQQQPDAFQQIRRRVHALSQKNVGLRFVIVQTHFAGDEDGRSVRRQILDGSNQLRTVEPRHGHVGQDQIDPTLFETFQRLFAPGKANDTVSACLQHDLAMGKRLFVIVDAQDGPFRFHFLSAVRWWAGSTQRKPTEAFLNMKNVRARCMLTGSRSTVKYRGR